MHELLIKISFINTPLLIVSSQLLLLHEEVRKVINIIKVLNRILYTLIG